ncbi:hypothetical protein A2U01_0115328, partial [Trifolium medium]|nr:hypothetical protein [Trifolium medium]
EVSPTRRAVGPLLPSSSEVLRAFLHHSEVNDGGHGEEGSDSSSYVNDEVGTCVHA